MTAADYEANLEANLSDLLGRIRSGRYHAPPVRRAYIPKADGTQRPLGIPTFEDKVAQRAVTMVLEAIYEQDFLSCSYGFRPGRSAHQALDALRGACMGCGVRWCIDVDIKSYFDTIDHGHLRSFLDQRVTDGVIRRMIDKWLKAGVLEEGRLHRPTQGSPQGGVISPCLSNIYLHHVLDEWFENMVRPRLRGRASLVRYADDLVMAFETFPDATRVLAVLDKRLARYGLTLHPDKTRLIDFRFKRPEGTHHSVAHGTTFDFLGFTHVWGKSRKGINVVRQVTAKGRYARALAAVTDWCRENRHRRRAARPPVDDDAGPLRLLWRDGQQSTGALVCPSGCADLAAMAVATGSSERLHMEALGGVPEATPVAATQDRPSLRLRERSSLLKNRMREICTSGSVRGGDGNIPAYSAEPRRDRSRRARGVIKPVVAAINVGLENP